MQTRYSSEHLPAMRPHYCSEDLHLSMVQLGQLLGCTRHKACKFTKAGRFGGWRIAPGHGGRGGTRFEVRASELIRRGFATADDVRRVLDHG